MTNKQIAENFLKELAESNNPSVKKADIVRKIRSVQYSQNKQLSEGNLELFLAERISKTRDTELQMSIKIAELAEDSKDTIKAYEVFGEELNYVLVEANA